MQSEVLLVYRLWLGQEREGHPTLLLWVWLLGVDTVVVHHGIVVSRLLILLPHLHYRILTRDSIESVLSVTVNE